MQIWMNGWNEGGMTQSNEKESEWLGSVCGSNNFSNIMQVEGMLSFIWPSLLVWDK